MLHFLYLTPNPCLTGTAITFPLSANATSTIRSWRNKGPRMQLHRRVQVLGGCEEQQLLRVLTRLMEGSAIARPTWSMEITSRCTLRPTRNSWQCISLLDIYE